MLYHVFSNIVWSVCRINKMVLVCSRKRKKEKWKRQPFYNLKRKRYYKRISLQTEVAEVVKETETQKTNKTPYFCPPQVYESHITHLPPSPHHLSKANDAVQHLRPPARIALPWVRRNETTFPSSHSLSFILSRPQHTQHNNTTTIIKEKPKPVYDCPNNKNNTLSHTLPLLYTTDTSPIPHNPHLFFYIL